MGDGTWRNFLEPMYEDQETDRSKTFKQNNGNENYDKITFSCSLLRILKFREPDYVLYIYYLI